MLTVTFKSQKKTKEDSNYFKFTISGICEMNLYRLTCCLQQIAQCCVLLSTADCTMLCAAVYSRLHNVVCCCLQQIAQCCVLLSTADCTMLCAAVYSRLHNVVCCCL